MLRPSALLLLVLAIAAAADPTATITVHRDPIKGRTVHGFYLQLDSVTSSAVTVGIAVSGTAVVGTDIESLGLNVVLPAGLPTDEAIYVPITTLATATVGRTVRCQLVNGTGYVVGGSSSVATVTIREPVTASSFQILGEPSLITASPADIWSYELHTQRPSYVPADAFTALIEDAPGSTGTPTDFTIGEASVANQTAPALISITWVPNVSGQLRLRITVTIDLDGLPPTSLHGATNPRNDDISVIQDIVLAVQPGGSG